jgi:hypothetical protein
MKISAFDGSITFPNGNVRKGLTRQEFLASHLGNSATARLVNKEWWHLAIEPEPGITCKLLFRENDLDAVFILMHIPSDDAGEWTEANELARKAVHDEWLQRELGRPPCEYRWGTVYSEFDAKGCVSEIIVRYAG